MSIIPIHVSIPLKIYQMLFAGIGGPAFIDINYSARSLEPELVVSPSILAGERVAVSYLEPQIYHSGTCPVILSFFIEKRTMVFR